MVALSLDGVTAVQALALAVPRPATGPTQWAPPPIVPSSRDFRSPWPPSTSSAEEEDARATVERELPEGAVLSPADEERFGGLIVWGVTAHMPDHSGIAGFGLDPASAYSALAGRLRGELPVSDVWVLEA